MTVTNRKYGVTQFFEQFCRDSKLWYPLVFVRNELGVVAESYGHINIENASLDSTISLTNEMGICLNIRLGTIKYLWYKAIC